MFWDLKCRFFSPLLSAYRYFMGLNPEFFVSLSPINFQKDSSLKVVGELTLVQSDNHLK